MDEDDFDDAFGEDLEEEEEMLGEEEEDLDTEDLDTSGRADTR